MALQPNEVKTEHIAAAAVTTAKIAPIAVTGEKLASGSVITEKIADGAVTKDKIGEKQVSTSRLKDTAVTTDKIANQAVTAPKIAGNAVTAEKIAAKAVTAEKLDTGAVTSPKIGSAQVTGDKIAGGAVTADKIANGAVTPSKLSFTPPSVARPITPAITTDEIGALQVTGSKLQDAAVTAAKLASNAIETAKIKDGAVTPTKLSFTVPSRPLTPPIATDEIADKAVTGAKIKDYDIGYTQIASNSINREKIINGEVLTEKIADDAVTVAKLDKVAPPTDGQLLSYEAASGRSKYVDPPAGGGGSKITLINPQTVFDETATSDRSAPLSIATVVPATAVGVLVELHQDGMIPSWAQPSTQIQHPMGGIALTAYITGDAAGTHPHYADNAGIVPVYSPQNIYLVINRVGVSTRVKLTVIGYVE